MLVAATAQFFFLRPLAAAQESAAVFTKAEIREAQADPKRYTINPDSVRITFLGEAEERDMSYVKLTEQARPLQDVLVSIEQIVNIAQKIWKIVEANRPVANIESKYATAYPAGVTAASQLSGWSRPKGYTYGFYAENLYGGVMINAKYKVAFTYGGAYKGKGKFITGAAVIPTMAEVGWGYKFYMNAAVPDSTITNTGTEADPVAAMQLKVSWKIATILKESDGTSVYYMDGTGYYQEIASPWKEGPLNGSAVIRDTLFVPPYAAPVQLPFGLSQDSISQLQW